MSRRTTNNQNMYGISRVDDPKYRTHAWRVSLTRHGKKHVKNFSDKHFGSRPAALKQAKIHRDKLVKRYPPITRKEFCDSTRRNNKTGITGVYQYNKPYSLKDGTVRECWYWEANWPTVEGESARVAFSVNKFGDEIAKQKAIRARQAGLRKVKGVFWTSKPGEVRKSASATPRPTKSKVNRVA